MPSHDRRVERPVRPRWPRRSRSAFLHALSLARVVLTTATDGVAGKVRLKYELALLREELRIKDARRERAASATRRNSSRSATLRRPGYRPDGGRLSRSRIAGLLRPNRRVSARPHHELSPLARWR